MIETILTLPHIDRILSNFENQWEMTSAEFLFRQDKRDLLPDDVIFEWDAMIDHKNALEELDSETHRQYLEDLQSGGAEACGDAELSREAAFSASQEQLAA